VSSFFLGLDTSCYTTSLAVLDETGGLVADRRQALQVKEGEKGLRQSEALFQHIQALPGLFASAGGFLQQTAAVAASSRPRPVAGSYMPVFLAGAGLARSLAAGLAALYVDSSHQEGHIMAGLKSAGLDWREFSVFHISGGTTEVLEVTREGWSFQVNRIAASQDLAAGQFIDRIGVRLGLPFPAGRHLEELGRRASRSLDLPVAVAGNRLSFSGPETRAARLLEEGTPPEVLARSVEECIARSLVQAARGNLPRQGGRILLVGGVMANGRIRDWLSRELQGFTMAFASPALSGDNAVGLAEMARLAWLDRGPGGDTGRDEL
jgi:N6-L-threonylcarbamoyladenine synthase